MAQPTLALTFQDLLIRVAEYLAVADYSGGSAALPTDAHDLDLCKRIVNDGYRKFLLANERGWNFLRPTFTITFVAGTATYDMPQGFTGIFIEPFTYDTNGPTTPIGVVDESYIRGVNSGGTTAGDPNVVAVYPKALTAASTGARWQAIFWPTPSGTQTVTARAELWPDKLVNNADQAVSGWVHDETLLAAVMSLAELQRDDRIGNHEANFQVLLKRSLRKDLANQPPRLGDYGDKSEGGPTVYSRPYTGVDTVSGVTV